MAKLSAFQRAFKEARDRGVAEFEFGGKQYNTKYKEEISAPAKKSEPKASQEFPKTPAPKLEKDYSRKITAFPGSSSMVSSQRRSETEEEEDALPEFGTKKPTPFPGSSALKMAKGGAVKKMASGGSASKRADGIAQRGKTRGKMC